MRNKFLSTIAWGQKIIKFEDWIEKPKHVKNRLVNWLLESFASFLLVFMIGIPLAYSTPGTPEIKNAAEYINKMYFLRVFYLATVFFITFLLWRKLKITAAPVPLVYAWASRGIDYKEFWIRLAWQFGGGILATFFLFLISLAVESFVEMNLSFDKDTGKWTGLGTSIGSPKPFIRGWLNTGNNVVTFHREYWFYGVRMIIEVIMIFLVMTGMFYFRKFRLRGHVFGRYLLQFIIIAVSLKFQAHSSNIIRLTSGIIMAQYFGGYHDWHLYGFVISGHLFALSTMFVAVRHTKIKFIN